MSTYSIKTIEHKGYTICLEPAGDCESPRDWGGVSTMLCFHHKYNLGDYRENPYTHDMFSGWEDFERQIKADGGVCVMPLTLYDHSGLTIYLTEEPHLVQYPQWDSMRVGFIFTTREKLQEWYGWKRLTKARKAKAVEQIKNELDMYDKYLRGDVYDIVIRDPNGDFVEHLATFYGYDDAENNMDEAKAVIDIYEYAEEV